jgi:hypothetical protein
MILHGLGLWLSDQLLSRHAVHELLRPPLPAYRRFPIQRFAAHSRPTVSGRLLEQLRRGAAPALIQAPADTPTRNVVDVDLPDAHLSPALLERRHGFVPPVDSLERLERSVDHVAEFAFAPSPIDLDVERRRRTVVVVDPDNPRNLKVWMRLPAHTTNSPNRPSPAARVLRMAQYAQRGFRLGGDDESAVHLQVAVDLLPTGEAPRLTDLRRYAMVWTEILIWQPSPADLAEYVLEGGFVLTTHLDGLARELRLRDPEAVERLYLTADHPIFSVRYDVEYQMIRDLPAANPCNTNILPVDAVEVHGRVVALSTYQTYHPGFVLYGSRGIRFHETAPCRSNRHAVNVFLYGLVQPGGFASRYRARTRRP